MASDEERTRELHFHYDAELDIYYKIGPNSSEDAQTPTKMPAPTTTIPNVPIGCKRTSRGEMSGSAKYANSSTNGSAHNGFSHKSSQEVIMKNKHTAAIEKCSVPRHRSTLCVSRVDVDTLEVSAAELDEEPVMLALIKYYEGISNSSFESLDFVKLEVGTNAIVDGWRHQVDWFERQFEHSMLGWRLELVDF